VQPQGNWKVKMKDDVSSTLYRDFSSSLWLQTAPPVVSQTMYPPPPTTTTHT